MIAYLKGRIIHFEEDRVLLLVGDIGYEVLINSNALEQIKLAEEDIQSFYIFYHQTEKQPKPILIGFNTIEEKEFFQLFITVDAIGPLKAVKALNKSASEIAQAIENKDVNFLTGLNGIGKRSAEKIIASLNGRLEKFILKEKISQQYNKLPRNIDSQVFNVLTSQLGYNNSVAKIMIEQAMKRNKDISTPEELFDEIMKSDVLK